MIKEENNHWIATGMTDVMTCLHQMDQTAIHYVKPILNADHLPCGFEMSCTDGVVGYSFRIDMSRKTDDEQFYLCVHVNGHARPPVIRNWTEGLRVKGRPHDNELLKEYQFLVLQQFGIVSSVDEVEDLCPDE